mmetsp:Transcript_111538/g.240397  ORF Transcript_111538/g.240397 Transcript_111538/m.240397 type:complete len:224 (+) Transcript_111538:634-1305(+)
MRRLDALRGVARVGGDLARRDVQGQPRDAGQPAQAAGRQQPDAAALRPRAEPHGQGARRVVEAGAVLLLVQQLDAADDRPLALRGGGRRRAVAHGRQGRLGVPGGGAAAAPLRAGLAVQRAVIGGDGRGAAAPPLREVWGGRAGGVPSGVPGRRRRPGRSPWCVQHVDVAARQHRRLGARVEARARGAPVRAGAAAVADAQGVAVVPAQELDWVHGAAPVANR